MYEELFLFAGLLLLLLFYLYYLGFFSTLTFQETKLGPMKILYLEYVGEYHKIGSLFRRVSQDFGPYFKFARLFGLYYDPPNKVLDRKQTRAIVGVILNSGESPKKEEKFVKAHIQYKKAELPLVDTSLTRFPNKNKFFMNYFLYAKVYKEISNYMMRKFGKDSSKIAYAGIMEVYYMNKTNSFIEFHVPHGPNIDKYLLSTAPKPIYKEEHLD